MIYREIEIVLSEHLGSLTENDHTVFAGIDTPFYRAQCSFGIIYAETELAARQEIIKLVDKQLNLLYPA